MGDMGIYRQESAADTVGKHSAIGILMEECIQAVLVDTVDREFLSLLVYGTSMLAGQVEAGSARPCWSFLFHLPREKEFGYRR